MFAKTCVMSATLLASSIIVLPAVTGIANASPNWDSIAKCESGGNWSINTGNGFSGGLQFAPGTWAANKPPGAPASASQATREQQIAAAERVLQTQGIKAWPVCGARG